ncbi:MAG: hypothetical protein IJ506_07495 [Clostridia bacterium]|nr:hypothetical protein [Clostridia bacterium]MBQ8658965.1 hypothetical protein [Clostridia bacterium]
MRKKKYLTATLLCACMLGGSAVAGSLSAYPSATADATLATATEIQEYYASGTAFTVPEGTIKVGNDEYPATEVSVIFPDGKAYSTPSFVLDATGTYTVLYATEVNGKTVKTEKTFLVQESLYNVSSSNSSVNYQPLTKTTKEQKTGLQITLKEGDTFTFNKPLDLNESGATEIIKLYPHTFSKIGGDGMQIESERITVRLTDCYDDKNYVDLIVANCSTGATNPLKAYMPYFRAGMFGATALGLEHNETKNVDGVTQKEILIEGKRYISRYDSKYGTLGEKCADDRGYTFYYDRETSRVSVDDGEWNLVNILNNDDIYDEPFAGFTTGEVYLSVFASEYVSSETHLEIESIGSYSGEELENAKIVDTKEPIITVNATNTQNIAIAKGAPFNVFSATATDVNLVGDVKVAIYYNYGTPLQTQIGYFDGAFIPNKTGWYSLVYTATDATGNTAQKVVNLWCVETASGQAIDLTVEKLQDCKAGKTNILPEHSTSGLNGNVHVEITAVSEKERVKINEETREFMPREIGVYEICYRYYDDVYEYEFSYELTSGASDGVIAQSTLNLPEYLLKGASYSFEKIGAYAYATGTREEKQTEIYVLQDGKGEYTKIAPELYTVEAETFVQFQVRYENSVLAESEKIPVVDVGVNGALKIENYFAGDFSNIKSAEGITYVANKTEGDTALKFVNPLFLSGFSFAFKVEKQYSSFETLEVSLVDYYDRANAFTVVYEKRSNGYVLSAGNQRHILYQNLTDVNHSIAYTPSTNTFSIANAGKEREIQNCVDFTSSRILLSVKITGLSGKGGLTVSSLVGQAFSQYVTEDLENPIVSYVSGAGRYQKGAVVNISAIDTLDVLNTVVEKDVKVFVMNAKRQYLTSTDNVLLDGTCPTNRAYQVKLDEYGEYTVFYTVLDGNQKQTTISYKITIADNQAPVLKLAKGYTEKTVVSATAGATVKIADYTVSDDIDPKDKITVFVAIVDPTNSTSILSKSFKATVKGDYTVCYYAYDSAGNYTSTYYTVRVK